MSIKQSRSSIPRTTITPKATSDCEHCGTKLRWKTSTKASPHRLPDYGFALDVHGVAVASCKSCRAAHAAIPSIDRFHRAVLEQILTKPTPLASPEIRFLRKALGLTGGELAERIGVSREHVSHTERGRTASLGPAADRLARILVAARIDPKMGLLKQLLGGLDERIGTRRSGRPARAKAYSVSLAAKRR